MGGDTRPLETVAVDVVAACDRITSATPAYANAAKRDCNASKDDYYESGVSDHVYPADGAYSEEQRGDSLHPPA